MHSNVNKLSTLMCFESFEPWFNWNWSIFAE